MGTDPDRDLTQEEEDRETLDTAHRRFRRIDEHESKWRGQASKELNFLALDHWTQDQKEERKGLPCLTFDKIGPAIDQVLNSNRQSPPEIRVNPVGAGADIDTAKVLQGHFRNIENDSQADIAYETAFDHAVSVGRGWFGIRFEFENDRDFKQKLHIFGVANPFSCYPDPASEDRAYADMGHFFKTDDVDIDDFKRENPHAKATVAAFEGQQDKPKSEWFPNGCVRVAEYWWVEKEVSYIAQLRDGSIVPWDDPRALNPDVQNIRKVEKKIVRMAKLSGSEILERMDDYKGDTIPYVAVVGREIIKDQKREFRGMIRPAMDANLSYDYMRSKEAQAIGLAPIAMYLVAQGALDGHESEWADANRKPFNVLSWNAYDEGGKPNPPPQRIMGEANISAITQAIAHADNDVKATTSEFDASLGKPVDQSGRAVIALQRQGDNAHFNYNDNLARSLRRCGKILLQLTPYVYSEARLITIFDPDGKVRQALINTNEENAQKIYGDFKAGVDKIYDFTNAADRYDVVMGTGPSFPTRMAEAAATLPQMIQVAPILMQVAPDLILKIMNLPYGEELVARVQQATGMGEGQDGIPAAAKKTIAELQQAVQQLGQALKNSTDENRREMWKLASQERQALIRALAQIAAVEAKGSVDSFLQKFEKHASSSLSILEKSDPIFQQIAQMQQQAQQPQQPQQPQPEPQQ